MDNVETWMLSPWWRLFRELKSLLHLLQQLPKLGETDVFQNQGVHAAFILKTEIEVRGASLEVGLKIARATPWPYPNNGELQLVQKNDYPAFDEYGTASNPPKITLIYLRLITVLHQLLEPFGWPNMRQKSVESLLALLFIQGNTDDFLNTERGAKFGATCHEADGAYSFEEIQAESKSFEFTIDSELPYVAPRVLTAFETLIEQLDTELRGEMAPDVYDELLRFGDRDLLNPQASHIVKSGTQTFPTKKALADYLGVTPRHVTNLLEKIPHYWENGFLFVRSDLVEAQRRKSRPKNS